IVEVVKQPGSNTVDVADQTKAKLAEMGHALGHDFKTTLLIDQSELIRANAEEVYVALFFGGAMAVLIILLFLLDPRGTFISSLALPTSVIGTFFVMFLLGYTLNQMTLLALSLAIGLLIDDAVAGRARPARRVRGHGAGVRAHPAHRAETQVDLLRRRDRRNGGQLRRNQRAPQRVPLGRGPLAVHRRPAAARLRLARSHRAALGGGGEAPPRHAGSE